ncbi:conserved Plasmodium protein, unknown function [Plasmodium malariae]|uniref:Uncharacterized protein n=1 Tax=Plasmodium malariae TaxID=5858 RepID=A0A1C3KDI8_PLAMA|nr:conserved Plasmodium protein, unknown function [Plasmodium malariae]
MFKSNKLLLLFFIFLNIGKSKKTKNNLYYNFLGSVNEHLINNNYIFSHRKQKNAVGKGTPKNKPGTYFLKYSNKNTNRLNYYKTVGSNNDKTSKIKSTLCETRNEEGLNKGNNNVKNVELKEASLSDRTEILSEETQTINKNEEFKPNILDYDIKNQLDKEIIARKLEDQKNEVIKKVKLPIIGTQLKPSGGFTKEILSIIRDSNNYINVVNEEIIKDKIDKKISGNDLSFFDTDETLEQHEIKYLNKIYDNNHVLNIYNFLLVWKEKKNLDLSVFVSKITENSNLLPGERTVIKFSEVEKVEFLKKIKKNRNVCVAMIFVDNKSRRSDEKAINHNMFPIGILAHPLDISLLDKSGEISVLNLYRFKINSYNVTNTDFLVNAELFVDSNTSLKNSELTQENKKIIINMYDKILDLKMRYNEKIGETTENEKLKHLEKIMERIDEYVNVLNINKSIDFRDNKLNFYTSLYLEYFSFLPLDIHANVHTKLQMMYTDNTELRLHNVKTFLMQIYDDLKSKLKGL